MKILKLVAGKGSGGNVGLPDGEVSCSSVFFLLSQNTTPKCHELTVRERQYQPQGIRLVMHHQHVCREGVEPQ